MAAVAFLVGMGVFACSTHAGMAWHAFVGMGRRVAWRGRGRGVNFCKPTTIEQKQQAEPASCVLLHLLPTNSHYTYLPACQCGVSRQVFSARMAIMTYSRHSPAV